MERWVTDKYDEGYRLSLGDMNEWWLTGDKDIKGWVDKFANIMELESAEADSLPKLIFFKMRSGNDPKHSLIDTWHENLDLSNSEGWGFHNFKNLRTWFHNDIPDVICEVNNDQWSGGIFENMGNALHCIYQRSIEKGGLPFHAGLAELAGRGVLLSAPGGKGKSTCCRRLSAYDKSWCDDETLVVYNKKKSYLAHPFPTWSDYVWKRAEKTWNVQHSIALSAIFFLERSETDGVVPIREGQAAIFINESATQVCRKFWKKLDGKNQRKYRTAIFSNACKISKSLPAFLLQVSLHGRFWEKMEKALG